MTNPPVGPRFRMAPGTVLRGGRRPPLPPAADPGADVAGPTETTGTAGPAGVAGPVGDDGTGATRIRNTLHDRAAIAVTVDPSWLLAPLYARDAARLAVAGAGLPGPLDEAVPAVPVTADRLAAAGDWPGWWAAALAYRPGTPAPRQEDLVASSPTLQRLWGELAGPYAAWLSARAPREPGPDARAAAVEGAALGSFAARRGREPGRWTLRILQIPVTGAYLHSPEPRRIVVSAALRGDPDAYAAALDARLPDHF